MDVSVVILSYNVSALLKDCIDSVLKFTKDLEYEIIVVDNKSTDDSVQVIKSYGDKIKFIQSSENGGFSKGNNIGIKEARGEYILLLNPDTVFLENTLERMFFWMNAHKDVGVASCQLLDLNQKITFTGGYFPTFARVFLWAFFLDDLPLVNKSINSYHPKWLAPKRYSEEFYLDWVTGAFFFMRKDVIDKVGMLDEDFFMYGEELELCMRVKKQGFKVGFTPITKIIHLERKSSAGGSENAIIGEWKGLRLIYKKHFSAINQYLLDSVLVFAAGLRALFWLIRFQPKTAKIYLKAMTL